MKIESLRLFIELSRAGSFNAAAKGLFITQQGLNKAVSALEAELETKLVERGRGGVRLTEDGELLLHHAKRIVAEHEELVDALLEKKRAGGSVEDPITLRVSYYAAQVAAGVPGLIQLMAQSAYIEEPFEKLVQHALNSDGSDLCFLDVHAHARKRIVEHPGLVFDPFISTWYGIVSRDGSPFAQARSLHRSQVCAQPVAINTFREMAQLTERLFSDHPLENVRLGATSPRMLLEYVQTAADGVAAFDSFGFYLAQRDPDMPTDGLCFTPLATPQALCSVGFLYSKRAKPTLRARRAASVLKRHLKEHFADYFARYSA